MPVSVCQTVSRNFHTPLVRSPADRTKVVTMGAHLKLTGLETFMSFTFFMTCSDFKAFRNWKSETASGSTEHRAAAFLICLKLRSGFLDFASCRLGFRGAGGSDFFCMASARNNSGEENEEGLSEGRDAVRARLVGSILSQD